MFILTDGKDVVVPLRNLGQLKQNVSTMTTGKYELYEVVTVTGPGLNSILHIEVFADHSYSCTIT